MRKQIMFGVLAVVMLFGVVGLASADSVAYPGSGTPRVASNAADLVDVKATVNPKITLTISTPAAAAQTVDFGDADPGVPENQNVIVAVDSNKDWSGTTALSGDNALLGLTTTLTGGFAGVKGNSATGGNTLTDTYTINVPWDTAPSATGYTAFVQYTVTQAP